MRAHMRRKRRPPRERLVAHRIFALVRPLPRVRPPMPREGAGVAECLVASRVLAHMRLLARMHALVDMQS